MKNGRKINISYFIELKVPLNVSAIEYIHIYISPMKKNVLPIKLGQTVAFKIHPDFRGEKKKKE